MSKIVELIQEHCPDGVDYKKVSDVSKRLFSGEFVKGDSLSPSQGFPYMNGGSAPTGFYHKTNAFADSIVVNSRGNCGFVSHMKTDFWAGNSCFVVEAGDGVCSRYLYYALCAFTPALIAKSLQKSTIPALNKKPFSEMLLPVPPIEVQQEIVRILDAMCELEAKLQEELEAREKQFEFYLDSLLELPNEVPRLKFADACSLHARIGWQQLTKKEHLSNGEYLLITGTDFTQNHTINYSNCVYVSEERYMQDSHIQIKNGDVLITKDGTLGKVAIAESLPGPATLNSGLFVVRDAIGSLDNRYIAFFLRSGHFFRTMKAQSTGSTIKHLTQKLFSRLYIPIPPIETQREIVAKLDEFETLIQNLRDEIAARHAQYEYYRDALLTFEKKGA